MVLSFFRNHEAQWHNNFLLILVRTFSLRNLAKIVRSSTYEGLVKDVRVVGVKLTQGKVKLGGEF